MKSYRVVFSPEAEAQLTQLYRYIADEASPEIALGFTSAIIDHCESLDQMPHRGVARGDLRPGLRTLSFRGRVLIAYAVGKDTVTILGIFYGGQDFETLLR
ncbi:MAG: type II toxin-antitoxin system RelE/ParE family toxin [Alphaproteobacteria bacterium]